MKKMILFSLLIPLMISTISTVVMSDYMPDIINRISLTKEDIPKGYIFGKIPAFARKVLKKNPWLMDSSAVRRLARQIYPGGNYRKISKIHVTIITYTKKPYGDDLVCYIILYHNSRTAKSEMEKIADYVKNNSDRTTLILKKNLAVFFHVDDADNLLIIRKMAKKVEKILDK